MQTTKFVPGSQRTLLILPTIDYSKNQACIVSWALNPSLPFSQVFSKEDLKESHKRNLDAKSGDAGLADDPRALDDLVWTRNDIVMKVVSLGRILHAATGDAVVDFKGEFAV